MRKTAQRKNAFPQNAEACPEKKRLSAKCGSLPRKKTAFRKMRKLAQRKNSFRQNAETCPEKKHISAKCGRLIQIKNKVPFFAEFTLNLQKPFVSYM